MAIPPSCEVTGIEFDLGKTLASGQIFHAMPRGEGWEILVGCELLLAEQSGGRLRVSDASLARRYFSLDHPLTQIYAAFPTDPYSQAALASCRGVRLIRQPRWECVATFITSPMKQVAHIRAISLMLRKRYGKAVPGSQAAAYPGPERLAVLSESDLRDCKLGFRAPGLLGSARAVAAGDIDLDALGGLPTPEARRELCRLPGVGRKVANCILLFAYERLDAVPVDVWIGRILTALRRKKGTALELEEYSARRFGPYAGYIQQYLFHHARVTRTLPTS